MSASPSLPDARKVLRENAQRPRPRSICRHPPRSTPQAEGSCQAADKLRDNHASWKPHERVRRSMQKRWPTVKRANVPKGASERPAMANPPTRAVADDSGHHHHRLLCDQATYSPSPRIMLQSPRRPCVGTTATCRCECRVTRRGLAQAPFCIPATK